MYYVTSSLNKFQINIIIFQLKTHKIYFSHELLIQMNI